MDVARRDLFRRVRPARPVPVRDTLTQHEDGTGGLVRWSRSRCPEPRSRSSTYCRRPDPPPPATSVPWRTSTFRVLLIQGVLVTAPVTQNSGGTQGASGATIAAAGTSQGAPSVAKATTASNSGAPAVPIRQLGSVRSWWGAATRLARLLCTSQSTQSASRYWSAPRSRSLTRSGRWCLRPSAGVAENARARVELILGSPLRQAPPTEPGELETFTVITEADRRDHRAARWPIPRRPGSASRWSGRAVLTSLATVTAWSPDEQFHLTNGAVLAALGKVPGLTDVRSNLAASKPQYQLVAVAKALDNTSDVVLVVRHPAEQLATGLAVEVPERQAGQLGLGPRRLLRESP